jgi:transcriptional regulator with XRE-family HTH domain
MTGNQLKQIREKLGLSQEKLARELDMAGSTVSRWEQLKEEDIPNSRMLELALGKIVADTNPPSSGTPKTETDE